MRKEFWIKLASSLVVFALLLAPVSATGAQGNDAPTGASQANPQAGPNTTVPNAPLDVPETLVWSGTVNDFMRVNTVLYWHSAGYCYTPPQGPNTPANPGDVPESATRVSTIQASPPRLIYYKDIRATNSCNQNGLANIYQYLMTSLLSASELVK